MGTAHASEPPDVTILIRQEMQKPVDLQSPSLVENRELVLSMRATIHTLCERIDVLCEQINSLSKERDSENEVSPNADVEKKDFLP